MGLSPEVAEPTGVLERLLDVLDDGIGQAQVPTGVVECFGVVAYVLVVEKALHGGRPEERAEAHLCGALFNHGHDVVRVFGRGRQTGVFKVVSSRLHAPADFIGAVRVRHYF